MTLSVLLPVQCVFGLHKYLCGFFSGMLKDGKSLSVPERLLKLFELNGLFPVQPTFK